MPITVEMDECVFLPIRSGRESLETSGVTTCICLMLYGHLESGAFFMGMYHWSGFNFDAPSSETHKKESVYGLAVRLALAAREQLHLPKGARLFLDKLYLVGGERQQVAPNGDLVLSGTEADVNALHQYIASQCKHVFITKEAKYYAANFLTQGKQDLTITMSALEPTWVINDEPTVVAAKTDTDDELDSSGPPSYKR